MIDTVRLFSQEYTLRPENRFRRKRETSEETGEVFCDRLYTNDGRLSADIEDGFLSVSASIPKLLYKTNLVELKDSDFGRTVSEVETGLDKIGVSIPHNRLSDFNLSRVDFCANLQVDHNCMDYLLELSKFSMSRRDKRDIAHETISFRNSDRELEFYNKIKEIRDKEKDKEVLRMVQNRPETILRVESRLKRNRVIRRLSGIADTKLENVFDLQLSRSHLLGEVQKLIRDSEQSEPEFNFEENLDLLDYVMSRRRRGGFKEFLAVKGVENFLTEFRYDWHKIGEFLRFRYSSRRTYEILSDLRNYQQLILDKPARDLLGEIKDKLRLVA